MKDGTHSEYIDELIEFYLTAITIETDLGKVELINTGYGWKITGLMYEKLYLSILTPTISSSSAYSAAESPELSNTAGQCLKALPTE